MRTGFGAVNAAMERNKPKRHAPRTPTKVYVLFPHGGSFSVKTIDYHGTELSVAATSVRQAYALAHQDIWIDPEHTHPTGIVSIYRRATGFTLWCGCSGHDVTGGQPRSRCRDTRTPRGNRRPPLRRPEPGRRRQGLTGR